jgi:hypothetical protein
MGSRGGRGRRRLRSLFALLEAVLGWEILALGLDERHGDGLGAVLERGEQDIIGAARGAAVASAVDDVRGGGGDINPDVGAWPNTLVDQIGINQLEAGLGFVARHQGGLLGKGPGCEGSRWPERVAGLVGDCVAVPPMTKSGAMMRRNGGEGKSKVRRLKS